MAAGSGQLIKINGLRGPRDAGAVTVENRVATAARGVTIVII